MNCLCLNEWTGFLLGRREGFLGKREAPTFCQGKGGLGPACFQQCQLAMSEGSPERLLSFSSPSTESRLQGLASTLES